jgi:HTH-type transcriptional regulator/antitoxin HigA
MDRIDTAPLQSRRDYYRALGEMADLMTARRNTPEGERLEALAEVVAAWERKHRTLELAA